MTRTGLKAIVVSDLVIKNWHSKTTVRAIQDPCFLTISSEKAEFNLRQTLNMVLDQSSEVEWRPRSLLMVLLIFDALFYSLHRVNLGMVVFS